ncbi:unnamed protein product [Didymodactylos carnosus]|uniref:Uncharacterized protein n=1 Tax=Didymodactylos carnosus TaxID=1234261 RepID=A0A815GJ56_9BILA|nr:unnamed protein product [Didymodactylos carnosus]CAF1340468.1 unnamed protein product [Didymodactylos carnosus]CAF4004905.1 unnamed protein product [Didymodactylos carnosus]CAF4201005.1 unnamed protein product [Didymodactylos carnosus]
MPKRKVILKPNNSKDAKNKQESVRKDLKKLITNDETNFSLIPYEAGQESDFEDIDNIEPTNIPEQVVTNEPVIWEKRDLVTDWILKFFSKKGKEMNVKPNHSDEPDITPFEVFSGSSMTTYLNI